MSVITSVRDLANLLSHEADKMDALEKEKSKLEKEKSKLEKEKSKLVKEKSKLVKEKAKLEKEKSKLEELNAAYSVGFEGFEKKLKAHKETTYIIHPPDTRKRKLSDDSTGPTSSPPTPIPPTDVEHPLDQPLSSPPIRPSSSLSSSPSSPGPSTTRKCSVCGKCDGHNRSTCPDVIRGMRAF